MLKKILKTIPTNRLLLYLLLLGLIPLVFVGWEFSLKKKELTKKARYVASVCELGRTYRQKEAQNERVRRHFAHSDPLYISNQLESLSFLNHEKKTLKQMILSESFPGSETIHDRLNFLTSPSNQLVFIEGNVHSFNGMYETQMTLAHPVEINSDDLSLLLQQIEDGALLGSPQLIITDFELEKKKDSNGSETFKVNNLKLLKREFEIHDQT